MLDHVAASVRLATPLPTRREAGPGVTLGTRLAVDTIGAITAVDTVSAGLGNLGERIVRH